MSNNGAEREHAVVATIPVEPLIYMIRGQRVVLDCDLAELYGVPVKRLNEAVKRNGARFPEDFVFRLKEDEYKEWQCLRSQTATLKRGQHRKYMPYEFTEPKKIGFHVRESRAVYGCKRGESQ